jgi:hypothetical protein
MRIAQATVAWTFCRISPTNEVKVILQTFLSKTLLQFKSVNVASSDRSQPFHWRVGFCLKRSLKMIIKNNHQKRCALAVDSSLPTERFTV